MIEESRSLAGEGRGLREKGSYAPGRVFVLAGGGLRHMCRTAASGDGGFLGYGPTDLFWKDVFELVHPDEETTLRGLIAGVIERPGTSASARVRLLDARDRWRWMDATVQNVLECPDGADGGLLVVNLRDLSGTA